MTPLFGFLLVVLVAFAGSYLMRRINLENPFIAGMVVSGIPYIALGFFLGPQGVDFLSQPILNRLEPFMVLPLGWAGLLFGVQLRWRNLVRFPRNYLLFTSVQSLVALATIFVVMYGLGRLLVGGEFPWLMESALVLAAAGAITAPMTIVRITITHKARGRLTHLLQFVSSLDGFWAVVLVGILFSLVSPTDMLQKNYLWFFLNIGLGIFTGLVFAYLLHIDFDEEELLLLVLGMVLFGSGAGFYLQLSPIFLCMVMGIVLAQFRREAEKVMRVVGYAEKPIYLFLLVFAGALLNPGQVMHWELVGIFLVARFVGKFLGGWVSARYIDCAFPVPGDVGKGLLSFGGLSLAIALNYRLFLGGGAGNLVLTSIVIAMLIFDELSVWLNLNLLKREQNIS